MSSDKYSTPEQAEAAFYAAFEQGDLYAMMNVWADDERITCIHPGAPRLQGTEMIREGWRQILESSTGLSFSISDVQATHDQYLAIHVVREEILINGEFTGAMLATNIYQRIDDSWHMTLHHASPEPDEYYDEVDTTYDDVVLH